MKTLSIREARAALTEVDALLAREGALLLTCRGQPVARLLPASPSARPRSYAHLRAKMKPLAVPSEVLIREDRDR